MNDLDRLEKAMASQRLVDDDWEEFVCDALLDVYPGLTRLPGGTDHGRDADIVELGRELPKRLLVTSARTYTGVRQNMLRGIASMKGHDVAVDRIVLGNRASLSNRNRINLQNAAQAEGAILDTAEVFDRGHFTDWLRRNGSWRQKLLGLSATPISLSRRPPSLAEQPWLDLPLIGRLSEIEQFQALSGDVIVTGVPGVGKSRFVYDAVSNENAVFVEIDYDAERIASDLREMGPVWVIVDDAERAETIIRQLQAWRRNEGDVFSFRIAAICWSNDADQVQSWIPSATTMSIELLERKPMDEIVVATGVTSQIARSEILDQSEGRVGWALSLCGILKRSQSGTEILNGKALYGNVETYLRRSGAADETADVLAAIAIVGPVSEDELSELEDVLSLSRRDLLSRIKAAAASGLVDVGREYSFEQEQYLRTYQVRPAMVANVLVAERVFGNDASVVDVRSWATKYPNRLGNAALAAIRTVLLGAENGIGLARSMTAQAVAADLQRPSVFVLMDEYSRIGRVEAEQVLTWLEDRLADLSTDDVESEERRWLAYSNIDRLSSIAARIAQMWASPRAVELLLAAGLIDNRTQHNHPGHPLRQLTDLVQSFHPEFPASNTMRMLIAESSVSWVNDDRWGDSRWAVFASVARAVLSLRRSAAYSHPGNVNALQLIETILEKNEMDEIVEKAWPLLREHVAHIEVAQAVIETIADWLRAGSGKDAPFGRPHLPQQVKHTRSLGVRLLRDMAASQGLPPSQSARLLNVARMFRIEVSVEIPEPYAPFLEPMKRSRDWERNRRQARERIEAAVGLWVDEDAHTVVSRLVDIRDEWPCPVLADT